MASEDEKRRNSEADRKFEAEFSGPVPGRDFDWMYNLPPNELTKLAEGGNAKAAYVLGDMSDQGSYGMRQDREKAVAWYRLAEKQEDGDALNNLGSMHYHGEGLPQDTAKAIDYYQRAARAGNAVALGNLGRHYLQGRAGLTQDTARGHAMLLEAAEKGDANSMVGAGYNFEHGRGTDVDVVKALYWYRRAAQKDDNNALLNLGLAYSFGDIVIRDQQKAFRLFEKANGLGNARAGLFLGEAYELGLGVEQNPRKALDYYRKAQEAGETEAAGAIDELLANHPDLRTDGGDQVDPFADFLQHSRLETSPGHLAAAAVYKAVLESGVQETDERCLRLQVELARALHQSGQFIEARACWLEALSTAERRDGAGSPALPPILLGLAGSERSLRMWRAAVQTLGHAIELAALIENPNVLSQGRDLLTAIAAQHGERHGLRASRASLA